MRRKIEGTKGHFSQLGRTERGEELKKTREEKDKRKKNRGQGETF